MERNEINPNRIFTRCYSMLFNVIENEIFEKSYCNYRIYEKTWFIVNSKTKQKKLDVKQTYNWLIRFIFNMVGEARRTNMYIIIQYYLITGVFLHFIFNNIYIQFDLFSFFFFDKVWILAFIYQKQYLINDHPCNSTDVFC